MLLYANSNLCTVNMGIWGVFNFISHPELQDMATNRMKQINNAPDILDMANKCYEPLSLSRYGEYQGYKVITDLGYEFDLVQSYKIHVGNNKEYKPAMSLAVGDSAWLTPTSLDSTSVVAMTISDMTYYMDDNLARLLGILMACDLQCGDEDIIIHGIPKELMSDMFINFLKWLSSTVLESEGLYSIKLIHPELLFMITYKLQVLTDPTKVFSMLLKSSISSVKAFLEVFYRTKLNGSILNSKFLKEIHFLFFARLGLVSKFTGNSIEFISYTDLLQCFDNTRQTKLVPQYYADTIKSIHKIKGEVYEIKADEDFESPIMFGLY